MRFTEREAALLRLYTFDSNRTPIATPGTPTIALALSNRSPDNPTKFFIMSLADLTRWQSLCSSGAFFWSTANKAVAHCYRDPAAPKGYTAVLLSRFVTDAPGHTYCKSRGNPLNLLPENWSYFPHSRGPALTAVEQLEARAKREHGRLPDVSIPSRLVDPDRLDWSDWSVKDAWTVRA